MLRSAPAKEFGLDVKAADEDQIAIACNVSGIFPKPRLTITYVFGQHNITKHAKYCRVRRTRELNSNFFLPLKLCHHFIPLPIHSIILGSTISELETRGWMES